MKWLWPTSVLFLFACNPIASKKDAAQDTHPENHSTLDVRIQNASSALHDESAFVKKITIDCEGDEKEAEFSEESQGMILFHNLENCDFNLEEFVVTKGGETLTYVRTNRESQGIPVYDASVENEVVDSKLAMSMVNVEDNCDYEGDCDFDNVDVQFIYSKLVGENVVLDNNLSVSTLEVGIESEPAPWCQISPYFVQSEWNAPELKISFSDCQDLFDSEELELTIFKLEENATFDIEGLHAAINNALTLQDASDDFEITLTLADLQDLAGTDKILEALAVDFVIAMRNKGGKSIKYYVVDNNCDALKMTNNEGCETAFAFGSTPLTSLGFSRWGWQLEISSGEELTTPIYAGAGNNDINAGTEVGTLEYSYDGSTLSVKFNMFEGFGLQTTHVYAGTVDTSTAAPGQFGNLHENLNDASMDSYSIALEADGVVKLVAHADVCSIEQ